MHSVDACQRDLVVTSSVEAAALPGRKTMALASVGKRLAMLGVLALGACGSPRTPAPASPPPPQLPQASPPPRQSQQPQQAPQAPQPQQALPPPVFSAPYRNWDEFRLHAGRRLVQTNPNSTFTGTVPQPLLAIPVLEVELNADGSVRRIVVQRQPSQARDTVQLAIEAVQRAAPFGDVSHLPRPWKFSEVFLFRDDRRFKPRVLDI